jgi:hypothetical protein
LEGELSLGGKQPFKKRDAKMSTFSRDLKYSLRGLLSSPGYSSIVVTTLALGIGANAAVFSLVDALILRPFPIPDVDRLVMLWETVPSQGEDRERASPANFLDWKEQSAAFDELVALEWWDVSLTGEGDPERLQGTFVSPRFFETLGVAAHLGRSLAADSDSRGARTVVLSYQLFSRRFGSDPSIVGDRSVSTASSTRFSTASPGARTAGKTSPPRKELRSGRRREAEWYWRRICSFSETPWSWITAWGCSPSTVT